jgi:hypothetical protein
VSRLPTDDIVPTDPGARRLAVIAWIVAAALGTVAVWWLSTYIESLTALGRTDREAAAALFKSRVLPALWVVSLISVVAGGVLARHGLQVLRSGRFPLDGPRVARDTPRRTGGAARVIGILLTTAGVLMSILPVAIVLLMMWALR